MTGNYCFCRQTEISWTYHWPEKSFVMDYFDAVRKPRRGSTWCHLCDQSKALLNQVLNTQTENRALFPANTEKAGLCFEVYITDGSWLPVSPVLGVVSLCFFSKVKASCVLIHTHSFLCAYLSPRQSQFSLITTATISTSSYYSSFLSKDNLETRRKPAASTYGYDF